MQVTLYDWIGFSGVAMLLLAYGLSLSGKISKSSNIYICLNIIGASLACLASWLIHYLPFVLLEGVWAMVSIFALLKKILKHEPA
jgi:hypothetical protein